MASKAAEDPSDRAGGSGNSLKTEEPAAKDPPKCAGGVGSGANNEEVATQAATPESVGGFEEAHSKGGAHRKRSSRLDKIVVVHHHRHHQPRSGGFMGSFPIIALALTWGMWKLDRLERSRERKTREAAAQVLDDKLKKFVHEREALHTLMKDVAVIKEEVVIKEKVNKKGGFWAIFQRG